MPFPEISGAGPLVAVIVRIAAPMLILRWPFGGMAVSILADVMDVVIVAAIQSGTFEDYTSLDKLLDTYALGFAALMSLFWKNSVARNTSIILFAYRVLGVLIFFLTSSRWVLLVFPNVFELFYLFHLTTLKWLDKIEVDDFRKLTIALSLLTLMKIAQEYVLHVGGFHPMPYFAGVLILTVLCCLPTGVASVIYAAQQRQMTRHDRADCAARAAAKARLWGLARVAIGSGMAIFWIVLTGLDFTVAHATVFSN